MNLSNFYPAVQRNALLSGTNRYKSKREFFRKEKKNKGTKVYSHKEALGGDHFTGATGAFVIEIRPADDGF
jgi:hypothetical protein